MMHLQEGVRSEVHYRYEPAHSPGLAPGGVLTPTIHLAAPSLDRQTLSTSVASLGARIVGYRSGEEFLAAKPHASGCLLCEVELPGMNGFEVQDRLRLDGSRLPAVIVSGKADIAGAVRAMRGGAVTFLRLACPAGELRSALAEALDRGRACGQRESGQRPAGDRFEALSPEDAAVLRLLLDGLPNKAVAIRLGVGLRTVERRRATALKTLGVDSIVAAALLRNEIAATRMPVSRVG